MPELPEVETVVRQLRQKVLRKKIDLVEVFDSKVVDARLQQEEPFSFQKISRRGKYIIMKFDSDRYLLTHLRMTGHFHYVPKVVPKFVPKVNGNKSFQNFLVAVFHFKKGGFLTHNSVRKFGTMRIVGREQLEDLESFLGLEPLGLSSEEFIEQVKQTPSAIIKSKLLDQKCIAGIGNIYAQEALYHAGINPAKKINQISNQKLAQLNEELQKVLRAAINNNGTTVNNYSHIDGEGGFQNFLAVYHQKACPKNHSLRKINIGGRSTYFCQSCQR